jgi:hypothetical protein
MMDRDPKVGDPEQEKEWDAVPDRTDLKHSAAAADVAEAADAEWGTDVKNKQKRNNRR